MAAISTLGYNTLKRRTIDASESFREAHVAVQFGDGTSTYPTGGVLLDKAQMGLPVYIYFSQFVDAMVGGFFPKYNTTTGKLQLFDSTGAEIANTATPNVSINMLARGY